VKTLPRTLAREEYSEHAEPLTKQHEFDHSGLRRVEGHIASQNKRNQGKRDAREAGRESDCWPHARDCLTPGTASRPGLVAAV
jgi:hypothetical protein